MGMEAFFSFVHSLRSFMGVVHPSDNLMMMHYGGGIAEALFDRKCMDMEYTER
jgi:hypothetical protein